MRKVFYLKLCLVFSLLFTNCQRNVRENEENTVFIEDKTPAAKGSDAPCDGCMVYWVQYKDGTVVEVSEIEWRQIKIK